MEEIANNYYVKQTAKTKITISNGKLKNKETSEHIYIVKLVSSSPENINLEINDNEIRQFINHEKSVFFQFKNCITDQLPMIVEHNVYVTRSSLKFFQTSLLFRYTTALNFAYFSLSGLLHTITDVLEYDIVIEINILKKKTFCINPDRSLSKELVALLKNDHALSDVTLKVNDTKEIKAHKVVLASRSTYFAQMFANNKFEETSKGCVNIANIDTEIFEILLHYIYSDELYSLEKYASELLIAADYYQINSLKNICIQHLCSAITIENFCHLLQLSHQYKIDELKESCLEYFKSNENYKAIAKTSLWMTVMPSSPEILATMMQIMCELL